MGDYSQNYGSSNLEFYNSNYDSSASTAAGNYAAPAYSPQSYHQNTSSSSSYSSSMHQRSASRGRALSAAFAAGGFDDEPPLLEELGINFEHIRKKALAVLNPLSSPSSVPREVLEDDDLAGPLLFCVLLGFLLLLAGKAHFGYIYGLALFGCLASYVILNLMARDGIDGVRAASILGYCLLPLVLLSSVAVFLDLHSWIGLVIAGACISWCTYSSSQMFVTVVNMKNQRVLVAYPMLLFYSCFALLTVF